MTPRIEVTIDAKGKATLRTVGYDGPAGRAASAELEAALGRVVADRPTAEHFRAAAAEQARTVELGRAAGD